MQSVEEIQKQITELEDEKARKDRDKATLEGRMETITAQLKNDFHVATIEEGEKLLQDLEKQATTLDEEKAAVDEELCKLLEKAERT